MGNVKIVLNRAGVRELLRSEGIQAYVDEAADNVLGRLGDGYGKDRYMGKNRCNAAVFPVTSEAVGDCLKNNTLLKAVGR